LHPRYLVRSRAASGQRLNIQSSQAKRAQPPPAQTTYMRS